MMFPVRKDPGRHYLIHRAEEAMRGDGDGKIGTEHSRGLSFSQHALNEIKILHHQVVRELPQKFGAMPKFGLKNDCQTAITAQPFQVKERDAAQFFPLVINFPYRGFGPPYEAMESRINS